MRYLYINSKLDIGNKEYQTSILPTELKDIKNYNISRSSNNYYLQFNFNKFDNLPHQGFKIHISATIFNYQKVLDLIFDFCNKHKISFKCISNLNELRKNFSGISSLWSTGKFITMYPKTNDQFVSIIKQLYCIDALKVEEGIHVLTDKRYENSNNIFYRYGVIRGNDKYIYNQKKERLYEDYQVLSYRLPQFINEPFPTNKVKINAKYVYKKYIPIKALNSKAAGSVFFAKTKDGKLCVLKTAAYGYSDGETTPIEKLKNEKHIIKKLKLNFIPEYIEDFYEGEDYFLVESYMQGMEVGDFRALPQNNFKTQKSSKVTIKFKKIINDLINKVNKLHDMNIFIGDISSKNIIVNPNTDTVLFIDLDQTHFIRNNNLTDKAFYRTLGYFDNKISNLMPKEQDLEQLGYLLIAFFCKANMFLGVDTSGNTTIRFFEKFAKENEIPQFFINMSLNLIRYHNIDLKNITDELNSNSKICYKETKQPLFPGKLYKKLSKTLQCAKLDKLYINKKIDITKDNDFIHSDKLKFVWLNIIRNNQNVEKYFEKKEIRCKVWNSLYCIEEKLNLLAKNEKVEHLYLENIINLISCSIEIAHKYGCSEEKLLKLENVINLVIKEYQVSAYGNIGYKVTYLSKYLSPYLSDGTAGILYVLLNIKKYFNINTYNKLILKLARSLSKNTIPKNASLYHGLGGIILSLVKYRKGFSDTSLDCKIKQMISNLEYYAIEYDDNTYIISPTYTQGTLDFENGNEGILFALDFAKVMF
ncbi:hypothetical protein F5ESL0245_02950 [Lactobacillus sp. ESL0245]|nr:hypothetical protein F5ESL0247_02950 [Lactobacillus sp. ESL0247]RMC29198.1 hypothetical protein F5ESL0246_02950 [Lactobacillus sp. ESL0246]RMC32801.1 hypothetical protein F5ESL0245_02950 [Lactobacillus sp. ESL0245]